MANLAKELREAANDAANAKRGNEITYVSNLYIDRVVKDLREAADELDRRAAPDVLAGDDELVKTVNNLIVAGVYTDNENVYGAHETAVKIVAALRTPPAVTEAMVEAACCAYIKHMPAAPLGADGVYPSAMRAARPPGGSEGFPLSDIGMSLEPSAETIEQINEIERNSAEAMRNAGKMRFGGK